MDMSIHIYGTPISMVSCQKGPTRHACAWQIGPFWHDTLNMIKWACEIILNTPAVNIQYSLFSLQMISYTMSL